MSRTLFASIFLLAGGLTLAACEQVVPADDLPYTNQLVIKGILVAGEKPDSISITHTLPLNQNYTIDAASTPGATATITVDGQSWPLTYIGGGFYRAAGIDSVRAGKTYTIDVQWNGLHASASTLVPGYPNITNVTLSAPRIDTMIYTYYGSGYQDTSISIHGQARMQLVPTPNAAYRILRDSIWSDSVYSHYTVSPDYSGSSYQEFTLSSDAAPDGTILINNVWYLSQYDTTSYSVDMTIAAYDRAYYEFIRTYQSYDNSGDIFGSGGTNPKWNITGDGIGIFIGEVTSTVRAEYKR